MELLRQRDPVIPLKPACEALGVPRSTAYRHLQPRKEAEVVEEGEIEKKARPPSPRKLSDQERAEIVEMMHSERFEDQTVRQAHAELLDEGKYMASVRTFYRVLAELGETKERRNQRKAKSNAIPRLEANKPNDVWTWDITKLPTLFSGVFLNLYLVLDLFSRYPVAWMLAERENSALSKQLFSEAITRYGIEPGTITVHNDRGAPMTAVGFTDLLAELGAERSLSRPRVSNDNPFSESCFKTVKYQPDYPGRFTGIAHARSWCDDFFDWYANVHRHSGLAFFTPADVFFGRVEELAEGRQRALNAAYEAHPERFVSGPPRVALPPARVAINPIPPEESVHENEQELARPSDSLLAANQKVSTVPVIALPGVENLDTGAENDEMRS
jgi:putative transposase